jgi:hypothetical protein
MTSKCYVKKIEEIDSETRKLYSAGIISLKSLKEAGLERLSSLLGEASRRRFILICIKMRILYLNRKVFFYNAL